MTEEQGGKNNGVEPVTAEVSNTPLPAETAAPLEPTTAAVAYKPELQDPANLRGGSEPIGGIPFGPKGK